jgi:hypothetical protein
MKNNKNNDYLFIYINKTNEFLKKMIIIKIINILKIIRNDIKMKEKMKFNKYKMIKLIKMYIENI